MELIFGCLVKCAAVVESVVVQNHGPDDQYELNRYIERVKDTRPEFAEAASRAKNRQVRVLEEDTHRAPQGLCHVLGWSYRNIGDLVASSPSHSAYDDHDQGYISVLGRFKIYLVQPVDTGGRYRKPFAVMPDKLELAHATDTAHAPGQTGGG